MSSKYPGGIITKNYTAPTPTSASGIWTLDQQEQAQQAGIWPFGGPFVYIEDVFSTYLYTGTGATLNTINNAIDLSTNGGLVWIKYRADSIYGYRIFDTARGVQKYLNSASTGAQSTDVDSLTAFNTNGFALGGSGTTESVNASGAAYVSWTFRKQPKFFDVVTWTGTGAATNTIPHNLGVTPGCVIMKTTSAAKFWAVQHRSISASTILSLNQTIAATTDPAFNSQYATASSFQVGSEFNVSSATYVAYLFAHNAGGFGSVGTDNVVSCGSFLITSGVDSTVTLGYEPQWLLIKKSTNVSDWRLIDTMRGMVVSTSTADDATLYPNTAGAETLNNTLYPTATGFVVPTTSTIFDAGDTYVYIAIRRGPMKTPTSATTVFSPVARTGTGANVTVASGFVTDTALTYNRGGTNPIIANRLTGTGYVATPSTAAEVAGGTTVYQASPWDVMSGIKYGTTSALTNQSGQSFANFFFQRAPGFFDQVTYTGDGTVGRQVPHNLGVTPEMFIVKVRSSGGAGENWESYWASLGNTRTMRIQTNATAATSTVWNNTSPTSTYFVVGGSGNVGSENSAGLSYNAWLFATCPGVSKVGSYTGTGTLTTIDCGFTGGARFVLIKRTNALANWFVWDTARGMTAGTDPSFALNSAAAETNANSVYTITTGFQLLASPSADVNTSGGNYIYLAIA